MKDHIRNVLLLALLVVAIYCANILRHIDNGWIGLSVDVSMIKDCLWHSQGDCR